MQSSLSLLKIIEGVSYCFVLELVPVRSEKIFKPRPRNRTLVALRVLFKISDAHPRPFDMGVLPPGALY